MPSKSKKQRRFMAAAANNPEFAKKVGISQSVAREFHEADKGYAKGQRFATGGLASLFYNAAGRPSVSGQGGAKGGLPRGPLGGTAQRASKAVLAGRNAPQPRATAASPGRRGALRAPSYGSSALNSNAAPRGGESQLGAALGRLDGLSRRVKQGARSPIMGKGPAR